MLFLSEVTPSLWAAELMDPNSAHASPQVSAELLQSVIAHAFDNYRIQLGKPNPETLWFAANEPSQLFAGYPEDLDADWDYLWRNASRIPITSIPEPTTASLLTGGAILLCLRRMRKTNG
ncbi:MAG TPA: hypothetical protein VFZ59_00915 [Verrucomicrobiae bacterium]|nr:hypothetical protein [Verrucomicrobiae bacterium]